MSTTTTTTTPSTKCFITGAGGFIGQALASKLTTEPSISQVILTDIFEPPVPKNAKSKGNIKSISADLTDPDVIRSTFDPPISCVYLLHGIMSSESESNLDLGLKVNVDSTRLILDHLRTASPGVKVVFTSSTAVYGPPPKPDSVLDETFAPDPQGSYGAQKHITETLVNDYSRRGLIDGRVVRLPTVVVRPGKPTGAASSFASAIFREPLSGQRSVLPVSKNLNLWVCSPKTVVKNLLLAMDIPQERLEGKSRIINIPGQTISVQHMLDALKVVGGEKALALLDEKKDEKIEKIVDGWPSRLDTMKAQDLGFADDGPFEQALREYIENYVEQKG